jgi:hypothetical protein
MAGPKPTYRIFTVPEHLDRVLINTRSLDVREILMSPPGLRPSGFGYHGLSSIQLTPEGVEGVGISAEQKLILLENGYL